MCEPFEDGFSYLKKDTSIKCWDSHHYIFSFSISLTFIFLWAVLMPLVVNYHLFKIRKRFSDPKNLKLYGIFYIGLNDDSFFWEICIVLIRKLILILCATIFGSQK